MIPSRGGTVELARPWSDAQTRASKLDRATRCFYPIPPFKSPLNFALSFRIAGSSGRTVSDSCSFFIASYDRLILLVFTSMSSTLTVITSLGLTMLLTLLTRPSASCEM